MSTAFVATGGIGDSNFRVLSYSPAKLSCLQSCRPRRRSCSIHVRSPCSRLLVVDLKPQPHNQAGFPFYAVYDTGTFSNNLGFVRVGSTPGVFEHSRPSGCLGAAVIDRIIIPALHLLDRTKSSSTCTKSTPLLTRGLNAEGNSDVA